MKIRHDGAEGGETSDAAPARRPVTDAERQEMRAMRAAGESNRTICRHLRRSAKCINAQIGRPSPRPPAYSPGGLRKKARREQALRGRGDEMRQAQHGYALPPGDPLTWGSISAEPWPVGGVAS